MRDLTETVLCAAIAVIIISLTVAFFGDFLSSLIGDAFDKLATATAGAAFYALLPDGYDPVDAPDCDSESEIE